jgi:hypothetical protein
MLEELAAVKFEAIILLACLRHDRGCGAAVRRE